MSRKQRTGKLMTKRIARLVSHDKTYQILSETFTFSNLYKGLSIVSFFQYKGKSKYVTKANQNAPPSRNVCFTHLFWVNAE